MERKPFTAEDAESGGSDKRTITTEGAEQVATRKPFTAEGAEYAEAGPGSSGLKS